MSGAQATSMVLARSQVETPVVTPKRASASMGDGEGGPESRRILRRLQREVEFLAAAAGSSAGTARRARP